MTVSGLGVLRFRLHDEYGSGDELALSVVLLCILAGQLEGLQD